MGTGEVGVVGGGHSGKGSRVNCKWGTSGRAVLGVTSVCRVEEVTVIGVLLGEPC